MKIRAELVAVLGEGKGHRDFSEGTKNVSGPASSKAKSETFEGLVLSSFALL